MTRAGILGGLLLIAGCGDDGGVDGDPDEAFDGLGPCDGGTWGGIADADQRIQVRASGNPDAPGTLDEPVSSVARGLELAVEQGKIGLAVGPGVFEASIQPQEPGSIAGCGMDQSVLEAVDDGLAAIDLGEAGAFDLSDLTVRGGQGGIVSAQAVDLGLRGVRVEQAVGVGVGVGPGSDVDVQGIVIFDTQNGLQDRGVGLAVEQGILGGSDVTIEGSIGVGLFAHASIVDLTVVRVADTARAGDELWGRGIHVQGGSLALAEVELDGNADAGLFGLGVDTAVIQGIVIFDTQNGLVADGVEGTGDGIVFTQGASGADAAAQQIEMRDGVMGGNNRAGAIFEDSTILLVDNVCNPDNGQMHGETSMFMQGTSVMHEDTASGDWAVSVEGEGMEPFAFNREPMALMFGE